MSTEPVNVFSRTRLLWLAPVASLGVVVGIFVFVGSSRFDPHVPELDFQEVSTESNIAFVHNNGAQGEELLPETMGSGVAFLDYDNDGDQDLFFVNSTYWPWEVAENLEPGKMVLYQNDGDGHFVDVTQKFGINRSVYGMGVAVGDYDNDGWVDLFVTTVGCDLLLKNRGGQRFEEVTDTAGVGGAENEWSTSAAWVDIDRDGLLDLFVCNFVRWPKEVGIELAFKLAGIGRGYAGPRVNFTGTVPYLYLNNGDGTFEESAAEFGLAFFDEITGYPEARSLAVVPVDVDSDGWMDLAIANQGLPNYVLRNLSGQRFENIGEDYERFSKGAAGIDVAVLGRGNSIGVTAGSFANEYSQVYLDDGDGLVFGDSETQAASGSQRFGMFFFDYDLDGRQDLLAVNGYLEPEINRIDPEVTFRRSSQLFWNSGGRSEVRFLEASDREVGAALFQPVVGRGAAFGDLDGDAAPDVVITQNGDVPLILKNRGGSNHSWIRIKLVGTKSNRDAIGAELAARVGNRIVRGRVMPSRSYLSQSELPVTLGLGNAWRVRELEVLWPSGNRERFAVVELNRDYEFVEGEGEAVSVEGIARSF